ncbi:O-antigen ligase family protein [Desulfuromonas versatilis]|uniref:O-antigen ligase family protein n=1 Tax=Desulfuromonas versatilis TaxID=2802975 RepID=UPI001C841CA3|nr:O-antigen ligase family protein [Desulfuromonas versatilis]
MSHIWKIFIAFLLIVFIFLLSSKKKFGNFPNTVIWGYLFAIWPFLVGLSSDNPTYDFFSTGQRFFPILFFHFYCLLNQKINLSTKFLIYFALFVTVSTIPFFLGLTQQIGKTYDLSRLGDYSGHSFVGIFQNPHAASISVSFAFIIIFYFFLNERNKKLKWFLGTTCLFLFYVEIMTMARAGYISLAAGVIFITIKNYKNLRKTISFLFLIFGFGILLYSTIDYSLLETRILGETKYRKSSDIDSISSGRFGLWADSFSIISNQDFIYFIGGIGLHHYRIAMYDEVGVFLFAHNGYLDELAIYGLIGFMLLVCFLASLAKDIKKSYHKTLGHSLLLAIIAFNFFQGFSFPLQLIVFSPFISRTPFYRPR